MANGPEGSMVFSTEYAPQRGQTLNMVWLLWLVGVFFFLLAVNFGVLWVWPTVAPRLGVPQRSPRARTTTPMMRHVVSRYPWVVEICGPFLHPIQPLAHEGLAQHILFDIHNMSGPIEHSERGSGAVVQ